MINFPSPFPTFKFLWLLLPFNNSGEHFRHVKFPQKVLFQLELPRDGTYIVVSFISVFKDRTKYNTNNVTEKQFWIDFEIISQRSNIGFFSIFEFHERKILIIKNTHIFFYE